MTDRIRLCRTNATSMAWSWQDLMTSAREPQALAEHVARRSFCRVRRQSASCYVNFTNGPRLDLCARLHTRADGSPGTYEYSAL